MAVAFHVVKKAEINPGDRVGIIGAVRIGLLSQAIAIEKGANQVLITDVFDYLLEIAVLESAKK